MSRAREFADLAGSADAGGLTGRNLLINGAMQVAQRSTQVTSISTGGYKSLDRMRHSASSLGTARFTQEQVTDSPDGFGHSLKLTTTTAEGSVGADDALRAIEYRIEGQDIQQLNYGSSSAQKVTLSFYVKSSLTGTYAVSLKASSATDRVISSTYTISSANTWERKTLTFDGDTSVAITNDNANRLTIFFCAGSGSDFTSTDSTSWIDYVSTGLHFGQTAQLQNTLNATWQITGVQLEVGEQATPFEHRSFGEELGLCQRYYQKSYDYGTAIGASTTIGAIFSRIGTSVSNQPVQVVFPVSMRGEPTDTIYSLAGTAGSVSDCGTSYSHDHDEGASINGTVGQTGFSKMQSVTMTAGNVYGFHYTMDAEL